MGVGLSAPRPGSDVVAVGCWPRVGGTVWNPTSVNAVAVDAAVYVSPVVAVAMPPSVELPVPVVSAALEEMVTS